MGSSAAAAAPVVVKPVENIQGELHAKALAIQIKIGQKTQQLEDLEAQIQEAAATKRDRGIITSLVLERNQIREELDQLTKRRSTMGAQLSMIKTAQDNKVQAELTRDGATTLSATLVETDAIDIQGAIMSYREGASKIEQQNLLLSSAFMHPSLVDSYAAADDEVNAIMMGEPLIPNKITQTPKQQQQQQQPSKTQQTNNDSIKE